MKNLYIVGASLLIFLLFYRRFKKCGVLTYIYVKSLFRKSSEKRQYEPDYETDVDSDEESIPPLSPNKKTD
tara:strand:- start:335 stop:547 length:213 start_codon:yes stop_codon:yes gene_type:complete